jgi:hypothetical protein
MEILVGVLACLSSAQGQTVYTQGVDLHVGVASNHVGDLYVGDDLSVDDNIDCDSVGENRQPDGYFGDVDAYSVSSDVVFCEQIGATESSYFFDYVTFYAGVEIVGKLYADGGIDPPYLLCDKQTRKEIVEKVRREVPPEKQGGAVLFFNVDTKTLETYIPEEGKFYNLQGTVVDSIPPAGAAPYQTLYSLDSLTGEVKARQRTVNNRYKLRPGYRLDEKAGRFVNAKTGQAVPKEQALSLYVASEDKVYDLRGNLIVKPRASIAGQLVTEHYLDSLTGEVKTRLNRVYDRFVIKDGFTLDKKTGQFIDQATGQTVPRETAVEIRKASREP